MSLLGPLLIAHVLLGSSDRLSVLKIYGKAASPIATAILRSIDKIQEKYPDGGGYFMGIKADPPECPVGYPLSLFGRPLLKPTRPTSYCSGATYSVLMEALNSLLPASRGTLSESQFELLRMQEKDGGRREDEVGFWGWWNADGAGSYYALCEYTDMGRRVAVKDAIAGDFVNISWKKGAGHSAVFLGWEHAPDGTPLMRFWSSQGSTNGFAQMTVPASSIADFVFVRLERPEAIFRLDPSKSMKRSRVEPDKPDFPIAWLCG